MASGLDPDRAKDKVRALGSEQLQAVVPRISASILHDPLPASGDVLAPDGAEARAGLIVVHTSSTSRLAGPALAFAGAASLVVWLAAGDARVALASGLLVCASWVVRWMDRWIPFSFGEGFVGYRSDLGWPPGVQEDDDVHWDWRSRSRPDA